ncbi:MAG: type II secretion system protein N [Armatimonadota bacterium]
MQDKKQTTQIIVLGVLVAIFVGAIGYMYFTPKSNKALPEPKSLKTEKPDKDVPKKSDEIEEKYSELPLSAFPNLTTTPARRDPFLQADFYRDSVNAINAPEVKIEINKIASKSTSGKSYSATKVSGNIKPFNPYTLGNENSPLPNTMNDVTLKDTTPDFTLTGVVKGDQNVAIIRTGEQGRHVVKQGETINGSYKVVSITEDSAVLLHNNRRVHVKLGGTQDAN